MTTDDVQAASGAQQTAAAEILHNTADAAAERLDAPPPRHPFWSETLPHFLNFLTIVLSFGLIAFISLDTFREVDYLENKIYMEYQLYVCIVFLLEYFYQFVASRHKFRFFIFSLPFLFISIPYLNIIEHYNLVVSPELLRYICFIPIVRGMVALIVVVKYLSKNLASTLFVSYVLVLVPFIYMSGLIFYVAEKAVNPEVKNFWNALWWAGMNATTIGCYINPVTPMGKVLSLVLSLMGLIMLPLFTVYCGQVIATYNDRLKDMTPKK